MGPVGPAGADLRPGMAMIKCLARKIALAIDRLTLKIGSVMLKDSSKGEGDEF